MADGVDVEMGGCGSAAGAGATGAALGAEAVAAEATESSLVDVFLMIKGQSKMKYKKT